VTTSFRRLALANDAERDIRGIPRFTRATWGERQRIEYAHRITDAMEKLMQFLIWASAGIRFLRACARVSSGSMLSITG